jgi:hypothetical protein
VLLCSAAIMAHTLELRVEGYGFRVKGFRV